MIISLKNISKTYKSKNFFNGKVYKSIALKDISIDIQEGQILGILGKNGSGKSTLLKTIFNLIIPDQGQILIDGSKNRYLKEIREICSQFNNNDRSFFWRLSVKENLNFFLSLNKNNIDQKNIIDLMELFDVKKNLDVRFDRLSAGEKKKVNLIRGLAKDPKILLFDEFTDSLDISSRAMLVSTIKKLKSENKIIIWVSHSIDELKELCDKIIILDKGCLKKTLINFSEDLSLEYINNLQ